MPRLARLAVTSAFVAALVSCAARPPGTREPIPAAEITREGRAWVRALQPPAAGNGEAEASAAEITPAYASSENELPAFPAFALRAGCGAASSASGCSSAPRET